MTTVLQFLLDTLLYVLHTLAHNGLALALGILTAAALQAYIDPEKMKAWLMRRSAVSIPATVAFGAFTPFCACGTMAVVISMLATSLPWGPVMAFLTSSPLMSPEGFVMMSGILGPMFAIALAAASVIIGVGSGYATHVIEKKTHFLDNQLRFLSDKKAPAPAACGSSGSENVEAPSPACGCGTKRAEAIVACCSAEEEECGCGESAAPAACGCGGAGAIALERPTMPGVFEPVAAFARKYKIDQVLKSVFELGVLRILPYFVLFAGIGYMINRLIPTAWVAGLFGAGNPFAVPLAALVGLPLYINGDSSIPLIQSLMQGGVSGGAMLAFLITGPGTSAGVLAGIATIMKKKAITLYAGYLFVGAVVLGYAYNLLLMFIGK